MNAKEENDVVFIMYYALTDEELKEMKEVLAIEQWTGLDLSCDEKEIKRKRENEKE